MIWTGGTCDFYGKEQIKDHGHAAYLEPTIAWQPPNVKEIFESKLLRLLLSDLDLTVMTSIVLLNAIPSYCGACNEHCKLHMKDVQDSGRGPNRMLIFAFVTCFGEHWCHFFLSGHMPKPSFFHKVLHALSCPLIILMNVGVYSKTFSNGYFEISAHWKWNFVWQMTILATFHV